MTPEENRMPVYDLSVNARVTWQAHSLSNAGNNGSNRLLARRQLLADGTETDAYHGNLSKHMHAILVTEYLESLQAPLCPACARRDGRRAGALIDESGYAQLTIERILSECALCDLHGFLVTAKNASADGTSTARQRIHKHTLIDFSYALGLPSLHAESTHLVTRVGNSKEEGQMLMKVPARSGVYAWCIRYNSAGVGVDTDRWQVVVTDPRERQVRHQAMLSALRDFLLSPQGALTGTMLPHLVGLQGAVVLRQTVGRAQIYSALDDTFVTRLCAMADEITQVYPFETVDGFYTLMNQLIQTTMPALPHTRKYDAKHGYQEDTKGSGEDI